MKENNTERLDKVIAKATGMSRSDARKAILRGFVSVDGKTVTNISEKISPENQKTEYSDKPVFYKEYCYILMNKPKGVLSASEDKKAKTVIDLLPDVYSNRNMFPVGRLDKDTTGLLIITDDGNFAHSLLTPKNKVEKEYIATLDGDIDDTVINAFKSGVTLIDGTKLAPAKLEALKKNNIVKVTITEGKYHQIKRMFGVYNLGVNELKRLSFGGIYLPNGMPEGQFRELNTSEIKQLQKVLK